MKFKPVLKMIMFAYALAAPANLFAQQAVSLADPLLPANAQPGECYARVLVPAQIATRTEQYLVKPETERVDIIPAKYEKATERVLVREASTRLEVISATYGWVVEQVISKPASTRLVEVPAVYETVTERIMVSPAHTEWKKGRGPIQKIDESTGEIMCLVEVPAVYNTISKRVMKSPITTREIQVPAEFTTVERRVMKSPPATREIEVPAEHKTITVTKLIEPAREFRTTIPAVYKNVMMTEQTSAARLEWRSILCETNMTQGRIADIQTALSKKGFSPGPVDGVVGAQTMRAVNNFQAKNNLPEDAYLNIATLKALGISPR